MAKQILNLDLYEILITNNIASPTGEIPEEGDVVFKHLCQVIDTHTNQPIMLDLSHLPKFTSAFLNNAIGKLFLKYDHQKLLQILEISGIKNTFDLDLLRATIKNAIEFSISNKNIDKRASK